MIKPRENLDWKGMQIDFFMKRDIIKEITDKKRRSYVKAQRFWNVSKKFGLINNLYEDIVSNDLDKTHKNELLKYIPISLITLLENYFRQLIKEIVLSDDKYLTNVNKLKNIKVDIETIIETQKKHLKIADLVSHLVSLSSLSDIINNLSIILEINFIKSFKGFLKSHKTLHIYSCDEILRSIERTYELRNVFVHEYAFKVKTNAKEIKNILDDSLIFIFLTDQLYFSKIKKT